MVVIRCPLNPMFRPAPPEKIRLLREKYHLPDGMWLYVAHAYQHKNHRRLFEAYRQLRTTRPGGWPLVLCGDKKGRDAEIRCLLQYLDIEKSVLWLPRLDDEEMPVLYSAAGALVFPSLFEGGGLPVIEAIACGCPVAASDIPTTREFAGDAAFLFDPSDARAIAHAMLTLETDHCARESLRQKGIHTAEEYRVEQAYTTLLTAYAEVARHKRAA
jgi:glycosyltransferase involved in cell wall biosynthesis